jgi:hypothetical protein
MTSDFPPMVAGNFWAGESFDPMRHPWLDDPLLVQVKLAGLALLVG